MGLPPEKVKLNMLFAGGSFGRRAQPTGDIAAEAASALKAIGRDASIKLVWTREDDMRGGRYRPLVLHGARHAGSGGQHLGLGPVVVGQSIIEGTPFEAMMTDGLDPTTVEGASDLPYAVPNLRVAARTMEVARAGAVVALGRPYAHGVRDRDLHRRAARRRRQGPVAFRLALLKDMRATAGVLRAVAKAAGWKGAKWAKAARAASPCISRSKATSRRSPRFRAGATDCRRSSACGARSTAASRSTPTT